MTLKPPLVIGTLLLVGCGIGMLIRFAGRLTVESPIAQRITELTSSELKLEFRPEFNPPHHFLIGVPGTAKRPPGFRGTLGIFDSAGKVQTISMDSDTAEYSNWLQEPSLTGFILAWDKRSDPVPDLQPGQTYHLHLSFTKPPPDGCSLWFSSMKRISVSTQQDAMKK